MKKPIIATAFALIAVLLLASCSSQPAVFSNADPAADFSRYKTFAFFEQLATDKKSGYESLESNFLKVAVTREMGKLGYRYGENPDLLVNFYINTKEKLYTRTTPSVVGYYGFRDEYYGAWGGYAYETQIDQYTEGTLNIDLVDAETKKLVWEGAVVGRVTQKSLQNLEEAINAAVAIVFEQFPSRQPPAR